MFQRLIPTAVVRAQWKVLADYRSDPSRPDWFTRAAVFGLPFVVGVVVFVTKTSIEEPGALLSGLALLAGGLLASFAQLSDLRLRLTDRATDRPNSERTDRDSLDETAAHILVSSYMAGLTCILLVVGQQLATDDQGRIVGWMAALVTACASHVGITFLVALPRLYSAYAMMNKVRSNLDGTYRSAKKKPSDDGKFLGSSD